MHIGAVRCGQFVKVRIITDVEPLNKDEILYEDAVTVGIVIIKWQVTRHPA
jgi:hypothetical protein